MKQHIVARYYNSNGIATAIVAVVTRDRFNHIIDWAAYIGGTTKTEHYEEGIEDVALHGNKMLQEDAEYFFPKLERWPYRI